MAAKKKQAHTLSLTTQQVEKLNALADKSATAQLALELYVTGILDANGLEGTWSFGTIEGDPPRIEVVRK